MQHRLWLKFITRNSRHWIGLRDIHRHYVQLFYLAITPINQLMVNVICMWARSPELNAIFLVMLSKINNLKLILLQYYHIVMWTGSKNKVMDSVPHHTSKKVLIKFSYSWIRYKHVVKLNRVYISYLEFAIITLYNPLTLFLIWKQLLIQLDFRNNNIAGCDILGNMLRHYKIKILVCDMFTYAGRFCRDIDQMLRQRLNYVVILGGTRRGLRNSPATNKLQRNVLR